MRCRCLGNYNQKIPPSNWLTLILIHKSYNALWTPSQCGVDSCFWQHTWTPLPTWQHLFFSAREWKGFGKPFSNPAHTRIRALTEGLLSIMAELYQNIFWRMGSAVLIQHYFIADCEGFLFLSHMNIHVLFTFSEAVMCLKLGFSTPPCSQLQWYWQASPADKNNCKKQRVMMECSFLQSSWTPVLPQVLSANHNAHNIQHAQSCVADEKRHSCFRSQPGVYITIFSWKYCEALQVSHVHVFCARYIWFCSCWPKKGSLPEAQLKFSIIIKPKEISINGGRFSKKHIPFIIVDRTAKQEVNIILNFTELTQQSLSSSWVASQDH